MKEQQLLGGGPSPADQVYKQRKCFIGYSQDTTWHSAFVEACKEVVPKSGLEVWDLNEHVGFTTLRKKVVRMIEGAACGIYDLYFSKHPDKSWEMPRDVLVELGMAIVLNRSALLLRYVGKEKYKLAQPDILKSVSIFEHKGGGSIKTAILAQLSWWKQQELEQGWQVHRCIFGKLDCKYRENHPRAIQLGQDKIHCYISDGDDEDRDVFRSDIDEVLDRFPHVALKDVDPSSIPQGYNFRLCSHCQTVRSMPFAIYRITPHTPPETFITIGMTIALETLFDYKIPKILLAECEEHIPKLLRGYDDTVIEVGFDSRAKNRLYSIIQEVTEQVQESAWKPKYQPHEKFTPDKNLLSPHKEIAQQADELAREEAEVTPGEISNSTSSTDINSYAEQTKQQDEATVLLDLRLPVTLLKELSTPLLELGLTLTEEVTRSNRFSRRQYTVVQNEVGQRRSLLYIPGQFLVDSKPANLDAIASLCLAFQKNSILIIFHDLSVLPAQEIREIIERDWAGARQIRAQLVPRRDIEDLASAEPELQKRIIIEMLQLYDLVRGNPTDLRNKQQSKILDKIFKEPIPQDLTNGDIENMMQELAKEHGGNFSLGADGRILVAMNGVNGVFHLSDPRKPVSGSTLRYILEYLQNAGIEPDQIMIDDDAERAREQIEKLETRPSSSRRRTSNSVKLQERLLVNKRLLQTIRDQFRLNRDFSKIGIRDLETWKKDLDNLLIELKRAKKDKEIYKFVLSIDMVEEKISDTIIQLNVALHLLRMIHDGEIGIQEQMESSIKLFELLENCRVNIDEALHQFRI